jgi:tetratricopeptide (TPR) repeat protein
MPMPATLQSTVRLLFLALLFATASAHADEYQDVNQLMAAGKLGEAMTKADAYLSGKPGDPQMRFLKGVLQRNSGKQTEAIATFIKLTEDYPALSEPYNNLAVIYAGQSQFDKARAALEMAIRTNPGYATAYENLGDVYVRLASQTYSKALELDIGNTMIPAKLAAIREAYKLNAKSPVPLAVKPVAAAALPVKAEMAASTAPTKSAATAATANKSEGDVEKAVLVWAKAWSSQDVATYLGAYGKEFNPPGSQSLAAWAQQRTDRITKKSGITVSVEGLSIKVIGNLATANFRQGYRSGALKETSQKSLELSRVGEQWLIVKETTVK